MTNELYVVGKRQTSLTGKTHTNIQSFDYKDEAIGLSMSVRDGDSDIRLFGKLIDIAVLHSFVIERAKPETDKA